ncbi:MAG: type I DNA topoisomerase [Oscillospiraceae bacterium]|nr:type I DNA topoisomerase [Oscillospiraceae bacterium]
MPKLVIVESPAKAKTIKKYLGRGYQVVASMGHVRDLPKTKLGVEIEDNFEPKYINIKGKGDLIKSLKKSAKGMDKIYLATDPDREGEAISWHLAYILNLDLEDLNRVTFNEITKTGIKTGMSNPRKLDMDLINAQQARRILDRIVGYKLSPFLWKKIRGGLSAGRVQSVALKMIVDRETDIREFISEEYYTIDAFLKSKNSGDNIVPFLSKFYGKKGKKININNREQANKILSDIKGQEFIIDSIKNGERKRQSSPPFITSTLQQEASRKLNFQSKRTMKISQELYEGIDLKGKGGSTGLITYMRTDSLRISDDARKEAYDHILKTYDDRYIPKTPKIYKKKGSSQDGHEAIRPTDPSLLPFDVKEFLTTDQYKIYNLIWKRFIASQMTDCILNTVKVVIHVSDYVFTSSGHTVKFDGFTVLYEEGKDEEDEKNYILPDLQEKEKLDVIKIEDKQHFTQPPPRYTEATLIKKLEEKGIGRPSTYSPTISTVINRTYVEREGKQLKPTSLGEITISLIAEHFADIVNLEFTFNMEESLDLVEYGKKEWKEILSDFYVGFKESFDKAEKELEGTKVDIPDEQTDEICDLCQKNMVVKMGRYGKFLACPSYPDCKFTKRITILTGGRCIICDKNVIEKKSKNGKKYYGCEDNPTCSFMSWDQAMKDNCPTCGKSLFKKAGKKGKIYCQVENCGYVKELNE